MLLPALTLLTALCVSMVGAVVGARAVPGRGAHRRPGVSRDEPVDAVLAETRARAPAGSEVTLERLPGGLVAVEVTATARLAGRFGPGIRVGGDVVAADEGDRDDGRRCGAARSDRPRSASGAARVPAACPRPGLRGAGSVLLVTVVAVVLSAATAALGLAAPWSPGSGPRPRRTSPRWPARKRCCAGGDACGAAGRVAAAGRARVVVCERGGERPCTWSSRSRCPAPRAGWTCHRPGHEPGPVCRRSPPAVRAFRPGGADRSSRARAGRSRGR